MSNSDDGRFAMMPCFNLDVGSDMTMVSSKSIYLIDMHGTVMHSVPLYPYQDLGAASGVRQVASESGDTFYLAGASADLWGWRYVPSLTSRTTYIIQGTSATAAGYADARSVGIVSGFLYGAAGPTDAGSSFVQIATATATSDTNAAIDYSPTLLAVGLDAWSYYLTSDIFVVSVDGGPGAHGQLNYYIYNGISWALNTNVIVDTSYGIYSTAARLEPFAGSGFVVYAASQVALYRVNMTNYSIRVVHAAATGEAVRGVALPPLTA